MLDRTPHFMGGGAEHSAEVMRLGNYVASNGVSGIIDALDLRVLETSTPGTNVRVMPGAASLLSRYSGASQQSYLIRNPTETLVPVPATTSSGPATRYLIVRVTDPQYEGAVPPDPTDHDYVTFALVSSITGLNYPFCALARINQPASTATIIDDYITDLRKVGNPQVDDVQRINAGITADTVTQKVLTSTATDGGLYPDIGGEQFVDIPTWATRVQVDARWLAVLYQPENATGWGDYWVKFSKTVGSTLYTANATTRFRWDHPVGDYSRGNWLFAEDMSIPFQLRGQTGVKFEMLARRDGGTSQPRMDLRSGVVWNLRFMQIADLSDS